MKRQILEISPDTHLQNYVPEYQHPSSPRIFVFWEGGGGAEVVATRLDGASL